MAGIFAEDFQATEGRSQSAGHESDECGFARSIGSDQCVSAFGEGQMQVVDAYDRPVHEGEVLKFEEVFFWTIVRSHYAFNTLETFQYANP